MLGQMMDVISFPVVQLLLMLKDERITAYLGVSVLGIAVTCMIVLIVFRSLVSTVNAGDLAASALNNRKPEKVDWSKRNKEIANRSGSRNGVKRK